MNVVDCTGCHTRLCHASLLLPEKEESPFFPERRKRSPIREVVRKEGQERACPVICVVFQPELEEEELAAEIADMYLHGRAYYYSGKPLPEQPKEDPISIKYKDVQWERLKRFMFN